MQATNPWHKFYLYRYQAIGLILILLTTAPAVGQNYNRENLMDYDNEWIHYGFSMGVHSSKYRIQYADRYATELDSLHSVVPNNTGGWRVGFVVNMRLIDKYLDVRLLPTIGFYQNSLTYRYSFDGTQHTEVKDATTVELPTLIKFKSSRQGNIAIYAVAGGNPALEVAGRGDNFDNSNNIKLRNFNVSLDAGVGFDLYFPLFKFSPEIRYTWGLRNMLPGEKGPYEEPFKRLTFENVAFYITFEGGPSYLRNARKANRKKR
ncbi:PorT family protein [Marinoscillum sp. MHG1-6]|uniref:type IX secretion/gliding motility protein PorT/SprT n=1 Tax=Marinoscillum sp. MHG1-6 TaxID=2959627 RepID=UPI0021582701|nr:PorT family protein [Marinoscillum sp. MHG1-6]